MILAYRKMRYYLDNTRIDMVVELRWFNNEDEFYAYTQKWRGDDWQKVETHDVVEKREANS